MNRETVFMIVCISVIAISSSSFYSREHRDPEKNTIGDTIIKYRDGLYEGQSQAGYSSEPYWGKVQVKIRNGNIRKINFMIRDSNLHETFNAEYKKHFEGNDEYIKQCINDWNGVRTYPQLLLKNRDIDKVDAISGATWSYNIFKASIEEALKKAVAH